MKLSERRWGWYVRSLPDLARSRALFLARNHTMTTFIRCKVLWDLCLEQLRRKVPGAFVECGVWRGGSAIVMGVAARKANPVPPLHLFDSFEGLPEPDANDGVQAAKYSDGKAGGKLVSIAKCDASLEYVKSALFGHAGLSPADVVFHQGWFQNTLPAEAKSIGPISVLRLDGDWYASTKICLEHLYPLLSRDGIVILDDYFLWEGCKKATEEYRQTFGISDPILPIDDECAYWRKTSAGS
jgi:O-methyltransferase